MLTANRIYEKIQNGSIVIDPFDPKRLNPNSYNIRLGNKLQVYKNKKIYHAAYVETLPIDMKENNEVEEIIIPETGLELSPRTLYLGTTMEYTETHNCIPCIDGRSSIGRLGLNIHATAGFGDIGFCGKWTLEISCIQPIIIYPYIEIGQIYYFEPDGEIDQYYRGKYQGQNDVQASKLYLERE